MYFYGGHTTSYFPKDVVLSNVTACQSTSDESCENQETSLQSSRE